MFAKGVKRLNVVKLERVSEGCVSAEFRRGITVGPARGALAQQKTPECKCNYCHLQ